MTVTVIERRLSFSFDSATTSDGSATAVMVCVLLCPVRCQTAVTVAEASAGNATAVLVVNGLPSTRNRTGAAFAAEPPTFVSFAASVYCPLAPRVAVRLLTVRLAAGS